VILVLVRYLPRLAPSSDLPATFSPTGAKDTAFGPVSPAGERGYGEGVVSVFSCQFSVESQESPLIRPIGHLLPHRGEGHCVWFPLPCPGGIQLSAFSFQL